MKRRVLQIGTAVVGVVVILLVLQSLPRQREIVLHVTDPAGQSVVGFVVVDGERQELSGRLPSEWTFSASTLEFMLHQNGSANSEHIRLSMSADEQEIGTVADQAVRGSCRFTGVGPIGSSEISIGGARTLQ